MKHLFNLSLLLLALLLPSTVIAHDFEVDGIYYNKTSATTVEVTYRDNYYNSYSGYVTIPSTITVRIAQNYQATFSVTAIGDSAFYTDYGYNWVVGMDDYGLEGVIIPETVVSIGDGAFLGNLLLHGVECLAIIPPVLNGDCFEDTRFSSISYTSGYGNYEDEGFFGLSNRLSVPEEAYESYINSNWKSEFCFITKIGEQSNELYTISRNGFDDEGYPTGNRIFLDSLYIKIEPTVEGSVVYLGYVLRSAHSNEIIYVSPEWEESNGYVHINWGGRVYVDYYYIVYSEEKGMFRGVGSGRFYFDPGLVISYEYVWEYDVPDGYYYPNEEGAFPGANGVFIDFLDEGAEVVSGYYDHLTTHDYYFCDGHIEHETESESLPYYYSGEINIPDNIYEFGVDVVSIGEGSFSHCPELNSVVIPNTVLTIKKSAFESSGLTSIDISNSVYDIEEDAFKTTPWFDNQPDGLIYAGLVAYKYKGIMPSGYCIILPDGTKGIAGGAFRNSTNLLNISIPCTVQKVGLEAFAGCDNILNVSIFGDGAWSAGALDVAVHRLDIASGITAIPGLKVNPREVYCYANVPPTCDENTFTDYTGTLHVPESSLAAYFTAPYWCNFLNIVGDAVELTDLTLNKDSAELLVGEQLSLNATIQPANASIDSITWESSNEEIATVVDGVVTAKALGECVIIVTCLDKRAICHIKVVEQVTTITLDQHRASLLPNHILTLTPTVTPVPTDLVVTSSNPSVAAARLANGKVQVVGVSVGTAIIKVSSADGNAVADSCFVNVYTEAGDVDGDGFVKIDDVTALIDHLLGSNSSIDVGNADLDFDGVVSIADVTTLIDYLLGGGASMSTRETFTVNGVNFTMIRVPAGSFMMGATEEQGSDANSWEKPVHEVTLTSSYLIGETEVTQELWLAVMGTNPSKHEGSLQKPVENVSWLDCQEFISRLNELTGLSFRMPTEAEWEYAARGANRSRGYKYAGSNDIADVGNVSSSTTMPVGSLQPNELNIYDMSGNVDEWVWDLFGYYTSEPQIDPTGPADGGSDHMYRGGSWYGGANVARVSYRFFRDSTFKRGTMGLRLAL